MDVENMNTLQSHFNCEINEKKYGKEYKDIKKYFIESFDIFLGIQENDKKVKELIKEIRIKIFDYIGIILTNDIDDLVNIIIKKHLYSENIICILDFIESIFNEELYNILIKNVIYEKVKNNIALTQEDKLYFVGIVKIETLKILIINNILQDDSTEEEFTKLARNKNIVKININKENEEIKDYIELCIKNYYTEFFKERIKESVNIISKYYNEVKTNFTSWDDVIASSKKIILSNNIFSYLKN
jgi:hypothetical protein